MAVRHGYGKIAGTDALVFAYDTGDTRNSYRGEPTTNVVNNPRPTSAWGISNYLSTSTRSYGTDENGEPMLIIDVTSAGSGYPRSTGAYLLSNITGTFSTSFEAKSNISGNSIALKIYENGSTKVTNTANLTTEWQRFTFDNQSTGFTLNQPYFYPVQNGIYYIRKVQIEAKAHSTPFVNGTRSSTQGLLDLTGNSSIDLANVSFDSNAVKIFDGTDDYIDSGYDFSWNNLNAASVELLLKPNTVSGGDYGIIGKEYPNWEWAFYQNGTSLSLVYWNTSGGHTNGMDFTVTAFPTANIWYHITYTWDKTTSIFYVNGVNLGSQTASNPSINQNRTNNVMIGGHTYVWGDRYWNGQIDITKFYNRALTADEVQTNYRHYKTRFNI